MTEQGTVIKQKDNFAQVRIGRNSACAACGKCGMTENQKHVDFFVENTLGAEVGDKVEVEIPDANTAPLAFVAYILPLIPALALMFVAFAVHLPDWAALLMFVGGFALGFVLVVIIDKVRKHKWMQSPTMVKIIPKPTSQTNVAQSDGVVSNVNDKTENADDNVEKL